MRQNAFNIVFFLALAATTTAVWWYADRNWFPKQDRPKKDEAEVAAEKQKKADEARAKPPEKADKAAPPAKPAEEAVAAVAGPAAFAAATPPPAPPEVEVPPLQQAKPPEPQTLIALGGPNFFNRVLLTTRGAGVQQVVVPAFNEADRLGREARQDGKPVPLYLIPGERRARGKFLREDYVVPTLQPGRVDSPELLAAMAEPSYTLFHYPTADDKYPDPLLGTTNWKVVEEEHPADGPHKVVFETELGDPHFLKVRKTYTLGPKDYHVGLRVEFTRLPGGQKGKGQVRYQVSGPRGLPVEGEWYTATTRVALIGWENKGRARRQYEDAASIGIKRGGEPVLSAAGENVFKYAAIATQYFTSALAVDDPDGRTAWSYVRATSELPPFLPSPEELKTLEDEAKANPAGFAAARLGYVREQMNRKMPELDDITFRAVSEPLDLAPGETVAHGYAIYNGPAKVRLLGLMKDSLAVDQSLVDRYQTGFGLRTITDFRSPTAIGAFADAIYWTDLVITFTNIMHGVLWLIHQVIPDWGVSIIVLTVLVRLLLFFPSRKQTAMNMKMVETQKRMKPDLDKLHEKYKDDPLAYNREKSRLMMQHGMNPFAAMGGCLLLFAQMPIFMGLYFCLQESIFFRLEPFLWISNLAAPDMTVWWSEEIPLVSDPENRHGGWSLLYLGPYLNVLPLFAVGLMLYQQNKMMPPPTDEQMAAQQRMMKIMMIVVAVMFYKVAAGLSLYFIVSSVWGIIERQLIPKPAIAPGETGKAAEPAPKGGSPNGPPAPDKPKGFLGRFRQRLQERIEELQRQAEEQASRQVKNNPNRAAPIRNPDRRDDGRDDRRDRKKKRK